MNKNQTKIWENTCDTIWDVFHNKYLLRYLYFWYKKHHHGRLKIWIDPKNKEQWFTEDFYTFVESIFSTVDTRRDFLKYIWEDLIRNQKKHEKIKDWYWVEGLVIFILSIDEIRKYLHHNVTGESSFLTIQWAFKRSIEVILTQAKKKTLTKWWRLGLSIYGSLVDAVETLENAISSEGDFMIIKEAINRVRYEVQMLGTWEIMSVNKKWRELWPLRIRRPKDNFDWDENNDDYVDLSPGLRLGPSNTTRKTWLALQEETPGVFFSEWSISDEPLSWGNDTPDINQDLKEPFSLNGDYYTTVKQVLRDILFYTRALRYICERKELVDASEMDRLETLEVFNQDTNTKEEWEDVSFLAFLTNSQAILMNSVKHIFPETVDRITANNPYREYKWLRIVKSNPNIKPTGRDADELRIRLVETDQD